MIARAIRPLFAAAALLVPAASAHAAVSIEHASVGGNSALAATEHAVSADGRSVVFETLDPLAANDTDGALDLYVRRDGVTTLLTPGTAQVMTFRRMTPDGSRVYFTTSEALAGGDSGTGQDVYVSNGGAVSLVSHGAAAASPVSFQGVSADGSTVVFRSTEDVVGGSDAGEPDLFARTPGGLVIVSTGSDEHASAAQPTVNAISPDGTRIVFETSKRLEPGDQDGVKDVYVRDGAVTTLVSSDTTTALSEFDGATPSLSHVWWHSADDATPLDDGDTNADDVFEWTPNSSVNRTHDTNDDATFQMGTPDGSTILFTTAEQVAPVDENDGAHVDTYLVEGGNQPVLVTPGTLDAGAGPNALAADGSRVIFSTESAATPADTDGNDDVYEHVVGGATRLLSIGPAGGNGDRSASVAAASPDATRVLLVTDEGLTADDTDTNRDDVYAFDGTGIELVTPGGSPAHGAFFGHASTDARTFSFFGQGSFAASDTDVEQDVYRAAPPAPPVPQQQQQQPQPSSGGGGGSTTAAPAPASAPLVAPVVRRAGDRVRPVLSRLRLRPRRVRRGRAIALSFRLSEAAQVRVALARGRRTARRTSAARRAGTGTLRLSTRRLRRGTYVLRLVATDAAGNVSRPVTARIRVT